MAINFLTTTNTLPEIQINDTGNNPRLQLQESGSVSGGISTTGGALVFEVSSGVEKARILSTGQFLIGHTSYYYAGTYLQVGNTSDNQNGLQITTSTSGNGYILFGDGTGASAYVGQIRYNHSNNSMVFNTSGSVAMTIDSSQKVGIGTTSPSDTLTIDNDNNLLLGLNAPAGNDAQLRFYSAGNYKSIIYRPASSDDLRFYTATSGDALTIKQDNKIGIGTTSPVEKLQINSGDVLINNSTISTLKSGGSLYIDLNTFGSYSGRNFRISDNGTSLVNVKQTGEFGIGTTNPAYKLDVNGDAARIGSSSQTTTTLYLTATNTAGAPAMASQIIMQGYEGRGIGTFYQDTTYTGEEWFSGLPYSGAFNYYQIGYDASGGQAEYAANSLFRVYHNGKTILSTYGSGTHTGTAAKYLAVTSSGEIIETGSGGVLPGGPYLPTAGGTMTGNLRINDNLNLYIGNQTDLVLAHNGTTSYISNYVGDLIIENADDDKNIVFKGDNGSGGVTEYFRVDGGDERVIFSKQARFLDSVEARFGTGGDFRLYHSGSTSFIQNFTGDLKLIQYATDGDIAFFSDDGSGGETEYFRLDGATTSIIVSASLGMYFNDGIAARFGNQGDALVYHDGTNSYFKNLTGNLIIEQNTDDADLIFRCDDGSGGVTEYFKLDGTNVRTLVSKPINLIDGIPLQFGNSQDLRIYHNGNNSYIQDAGTGSLKILAQDFDVVNAAESALMIRAIDGAQAELYYGGAKKFETTSAGVEITGNLDSPTISINDYISHNGDSDTKIGFNTANNIELIAGGNLQISADASRSYLRYQGSSKLYTDTTGVYILGRTTISGTNTFFIESNSTAATFNLNSGTRGFQFINNNATLLSLASDGHATFASGITATNTSFSGTVNIASPIYHIGDTNTWFGFNTADSIQLVTGGGQRLLANNNGVRIGSGATVTTILDEDNMASNSDTALATQQSIKAYVDSSITGSTTYRGTWDPDVSLNSGYGNPNLNTVTKQDGYYYICSDNGSATPNGSGTEPNSWHTGDWVVYNSDLGSSGEWQKIDNTSVLSGTGTGQKVAKWDGSGTSETLADGPITFSSNNSTFAGTLTVNGADAITIPDYILHDGDDSKFGFPSNDNFKIRLAGSDIFTMSTTDATFAGRFIIQDTDTESFRINGTSSTGSFVRYQTNGTNIGFFGAAYHLIASSPSGYENDFGIRAESDFRIAIGASEKMCIINNGNVGIGTNSPTANLYVSGSNANATDKATMMSESVFTVKPVALNSGNLNFAQVNSGNAIGMQFTNGNGTANWDISMQPFGGNVGIGTTNPTQTLDVDGAIITEDYRAASIFYLTSGGDWRFRTDTGSERIRITSGGNVGIGTNSPQAALHVAGAFNTNSPTGNGVLMGLYNSTHGYIQLNGPSGGYIDFSTSGTDHKGRILYDNSSNYLRFDTNGTEKMRITSAGSVGIGTTAPSRKLDINAGSDYPLSIDSTQQYLMEFARNGTSEWWIAVSGGFKIHENGVGDHMIIKDGGKVGIGTTSPTYDLSVNGAISGAGFVTYAKSYGSLNTTGNAVAGITTGSNGASCGFTFTCFGGTGKYQRIVYSCYNDSGTWRPKKVIDEGTNDLDVTASADGATITFTFKARSSSQSYTPRVKVEADGQSINSTYA